MSFNFEKIFTIHLVCFKCDKSLEYYSPKDLSEMFIGSTMFQCPRCNIK